MKMGPFLRKVQLPLVRLGCYHQLILSTVHLLVIIRPTLTSFCSIKSSVQGFRLECCVFDANRVMTTIMPNPATHQEIMAGTKVFSVVYINEKS